jgi:DNA-binding response OmpR family regulator
MLADASEQNEEVRRVSELACSEVVMDRGPLRILQVDDEEDAYLLTRLKLAESPAERFVLEWVATYEAALLAMARNHHDVYLVDYRLGERSGLDLLREALAQGCSGPIIMLTGQSQYVVDREAMAGGAADYLTKDELSPRLLERAIRYALERQRVDAAVHEFQFMGARLEGVTLAARTMSHYVSNALVAPVAAIDLLRRQGIAPAHMRGLMDEAATGLMEARQCIEQLQRVVRVTTKETVVGPALDLDRSVRSAASESVTCLGDG